MLERGPICESCRWHWIGYACASGRLEHERAEVSDGDQGYPIGSDLRGLARATYRNSDTVKPIHPAALDPDADLPPQPTWRRWLDKHRQRDPNGPPDELVPSASR